MPSELEDIDQQFFELFDRLIADIRKSALAEVDDGLKYVMARRVSGQWEKLASIGKLRLVRVIGRSFWGPNGLSVCLEGSLGLEKLAQVLLGLHTRFMYLLQQDIRRGPREKEQAAPPPRSKERKKVLVVDDKVNIRRLIVTHLRKLNCDIIEAGDGDEALELARKLKPSVVLLDIMMPRLDGVETCRRLRQMPECADIAIIMCSVKTGHKDVAESLAAGADDYIVKPFTAAIILTKISDALEPPEAADKGSGEVINR